MRIFYGVLWLIHRMYMLKWNPLLESTNSSIVTLLRPSLCGTQSQGGAVRRQAEDINCCIATDDDPPLCHSVLISAFNKIPFVEPQPGRRAVAISVQQFSSYEKRQHKIPSRLMASKRVKITQTCTGHDTDIHITFLDMFVRKFFVPPVTKLESYIWTVLTNAWPAGNRLKCPLFLFSFDWNSNESTNLSNTIL